jgi:thymidylate synthase
VTIIYQEQQYIDLSKEIRLEKSDQTGRRSKDRIRTLDGIRSEKFYTHLDNQARFRSRSHRRTPVVCFRKFGRHGSWTQERQDLGNNTSRQFLDDIGLNDLEEGDTGPLYGHTLRHCGAGTSVRMPTTPDGGSAEERYRDHQIRPLRKTSRRHLVGTRKRSESPSYPCHGGMIQFFVSMSGELSCVMYQRSVDAFLGLPFNIMSYAVLTYMIAQVCGLRPGI